MFRRVVAAIRTIVVATAPQRAATAYATSRSPSAPAIAGTIRVVAAVVLLSVLCFAQGCSDECQPGEYPTGCTADHQARATCMEGDVGPNKLDIEPCPAFEPTCYAGRCIKLSDSLTAAALGKGPYDDPCKMSCEFAHDAKCIDSDDYYAGCLAYCEQVASKTPGSCAGAVHASFECFTSDERYSCINGSDKLQLDMKVPGLCDDMGGACTSCRGARCEEYYWFRAAQR